MITPDEAWNLVLDVVRPLPVIERALAESLHYVLAEPIRADRDIPPADRSAMDGYAVRAEDIRRAPAVLTVRGEAAAGSGSAPAVGPGTCVRIFTGANVPPGADTVVRLEDTQAAHDPDGREAIAVLKAAEAGADILRQGENARSGDVLLPAGTRLSPTGIGLCAATGHAAVKVHRQPRIHILTTGEELRDAGDPVAPHQIRDSNGPMLAAALSAAGFSVHGRGRVPDDPGLTTQGIRAALADADALLTVGGISVGRYDWVPRCVAEAGGAVRFHQVAIKPGKPLLFAATPEGKLIWGLPGNPVSAMVAFQEFVLPSLFRLSGLSAEASRESVLLPLRGKVKGGGSRRTYLLARRVADAGGIGLEPVRSTGSADLVALGRADGCFAVPDGVAGLDAGALVPFRAWRRGL